MIDTVEISHKLQAAGMPEEQADAVAQALLEVPKTAELVTKDYLKAELSSTKLQLVYWIVGAGLAQIAATFLHH